MGLLKKWGMTTPRTIVVGSADAFEAAAASEDWPGKSPLVVKAHEAIGSRMKQGLVKVGLDLEGARKAVREMLGKRVGGGMTVSQVIVSESVEHQKEYYIAVKSVREGAELFLAGEPKPEDLKKLAEQAGFGAKLIPAVAEFAAKLYRCFDQEDGQYIEINPLVQNSGGELVALDAVTLLDADARFRHPDWNFSFAAEFGRPYTEAEKAVMEVDGRIKGSVKFIEIPGGDTALLPAGGGASVFYTDAVVALGGKPANYAEYSGDPPDWAVEALTERVCALPGIKRIIVGGAIANFTNVKKTFAGIIAGFRKSKTQGRLNGVEIWVRRGGPFEKEGLAAMAALKEEGFNVHVFDRHTPLTDIVDYSIKGTQR
jgi:ATP-citrate lyase beta-subunit